MDTKVKLWFLWSRGILAETSVCLADQGECSEDKSGWNRKAARSSRTHAAEFLQPRVSPPKLNEFFLKSSFLLASTPPSACKLTYFLFNLSAAMEGAWERTGGKDGERTKVRHQKTVWETEGNTFPSDFWGCLCVLSTQQYTKEQYKSFFPLLAHYLLSFSVVTLTSPLHLESRFPTETDRDFISKPHSANSRSLRQTFLEEAHRH